MQEPLWESFFKDKIRKIFTHNTEVIDIGGGLRIDRTKNNRFEKTREWIIPLAQKISYKVLDPVPDYHPDIVGDIHHLPMADSTVQAITCMAVLEHVEDPIRAAAEMHRVLVPNGQLFVYVPFLYYYHAHGGYYKDFWRFTEDSLRYMFRDFSHIEIVSVRYAIETIIRITPLGRFAFMITIARYCDQLFGYQKSKQVSGFNVYLEK